MKKEDIMGMATRLIHGHQPQQPDGAVMPHIVTSTTFERMPDGLNFRDGYIYARYDNPNRRTLEGQLADLEQGISAVTFASGLAAAQAVFHSLKPGDHAIIPDNIYFGVQNILMRLYGHWGLTFSRVDMSSADHVVAAIQPNTRLIWLETPSNPLLNIADIAAIVAIAKAHNCFTVADNTWATPYSTLPLTLGVDIVHHSTTKYIGGHSDLMGGALIFSDTDNEQYEFIRDYQHVGGAVPSPQDCWLMSRSLATFAARMAIHNSNAAQLAQFLAEHPAVEKVLYPGLEEHPGHEVAARQMQNRFGGMLSILVRGGQEEALRLCGNLQLLRHATSLGGVESLIEHRRSSEGKNASSPDNLLRVSVGIEEITDLISDFDQALTK